MPEPGFPLSHVIVMYCIHLVRIREDG
jgi:hypothetical protein